MNERVVRLVYQKKKLVSASFAKLQFLTERRGHDYKHLESSNGSTLLDLRVWQGTLHAGERIKGQRASNNMDAVQTIMLDQNEDEVDTLKFFKEHHWVFASS